MTDTARNDTQVNDTWAQGDGYEAYVGRWSRPVAAEFLTWLAVASERAWLDLGCGTGALSRRILDSANPAKVVGIDSSDGFVAHARAHVVDPRVEFRVGDARALPAADAAFDAVVSGLVLNFIPDPAKALADMRRVARPGATIAAYVWDYAGEMQLMRRFWDAADALDAAARELDEGRRFPLCHPEPLRALFAAAGLREVATRAIDVPTVFKNFDDYWSPFLAAQGPAPGYCVKLPDEARAALRERLRTSLPADADGTIRLIARAWAVQGVN